MEVRETAATFDLPEPRVCFAGDWHGDAGFMRMALRGLARIAPDVRTVLHAGDWSMNLRKSDEVCRAYGIDRVVVCPGNHDDWGTISPLLAANPGEAIRVSEAVWLLPRPFRMRLGDRSLLALSGATSVDRYWRAPGDWWPDETITDDDVETAIKGGPADLMLAHETPAGTPVRAVQNILRSNPLGFPKESLIESAASRVRVRQVWDSVKPRILIHGHMHAAGGGTTEDGRRVISLGCNGQQGNLALLDLRDLTVEVPALRDLRGDDLGRTSGTTP